MKKQSSIEWLEEQLRIHTWYDNDNNAQVNIDAIDIDQAKQMHKQEIEHAHLHNRCSGDQSSKCFIEALENAQQYHKDTFTVKP